MRFAALKHLIATMPLWLGGSAVGQLAAWIDFNGEIEGSATEVGHVGWIPIYGFGIGGKLEQREPGIFSIRKPVDRASPEMFLSCAKGRRFPKATLDLNRTGTHKEPRLVRLEFEDVWIESQAVSGDTGEDRPMEITGIQFRAITYTYIMPDSKTSVGSYAYAEDPDPPPNPDTDNDGMPDTWELQNGLTVGTNDAGGDLDGDGLTNFQEFQLGTKANSGTSFFKATLSKNEAMPGVYQISWNSVVGKTYVIESTLDLAVPFAPLRTVTATTTSTTESINLSGPAGFFRVRPQ